MNNVKVASALNTISLAFGELAEALTEEQGPMTLGAASAALSAALEPFSEEEAEALAVEAFVGPEGSEAMCPKHRIPFTEGTYGAYCRSQTDDPAWGKAKGDKLWCRITPKSAAEWLRQRAAA